MEKLAVDGRVVNCPRWVHRTDGASTVVTRVLFNKLDR